MEATCAEASHIIHDGPRCAQAAPLHLIRSIDPNRAHRPPSRPFIRCNHLLGSLPIESYTFTLMAADLSIMMGHRAAQQARQRALSLPAHLCSCTLHFVPVTMRGRESTPSLC